MKITKLILALILALFVVACSNSDDNNDNNGDTNNDSSDMGSSADGVSFTTLCGIILDALFSPSVPNDRAELVTVSVTDSDTVVVTRQEGIEAGNQQAIKLHGVTADGVSSFLREQGKDLIESFTTPFAFLVQSGAPADGCNFLFPGGGEGVFGQLFSPSGVNINERLIAQGSVVPVVQGCMDDVLAGCYSTIEVEETFSPTTISWFLWKPVSERDGGLVILVDPVGITVVVNGETLTDFGPSNDRGTTARSSRSGGSFGGNITVQFFDSQGRRVTLNDGRTEVIIPNGSERVEFRV